MTAALVICGLLALWFLLRRDYVTPLAIVFFLGAILASRFMP
ncbi:glucan phosphoethanolaminetransferase (alkaline phosphatase superfamily) [Bradyrhizobium sp. USDA 4503]